MNLQEEQVEREDSETWEDPFRTLGNVKRPGCKVVCPAGSRASKAASVLVKQRARRGAAEWQWRGTRGAVCVGPYKALWGLRLSLNPRGAAFFNRGRCPCCCVWKETLQVPERVRGISFNPTLTTTPSNAQGLCSAARVYSLCQVFFHLISFQIRVSDAVSGCQSLSHEPSG